MDVEGGRFPPSPSDEIGDAGEGRIGTEPAFQTCSVMCSAPGEGLIARMDLVEGAGGLMSPLGEEEYVADLALAFGFPLVIVTRNALGTINHTLQTPIAAAPFR